MAVVSFSEAARLCGHKSRSTLYRLRDSGDLRRYLLPPVRDGAAPLLDTHPAGAPPLAEHVRSVTRQQASSPALRPQDLAERRAELADRRRWELVAGALSDALTADGLRLQLSGPEAAAIAAALPAALGEAPRADLLREIAGLREQLAGWESREADRLRRLQQEMGGHLQFPADGEESPEIDDSEFWRQVRAVVGRLYAGPLPENPAWFVSLCGAVSDAVEAIEAGARFDPEWWDAGDTRLSLWRLREGDRGEAAELRQLLADGAVPAQLLAEVREALAGAPSPPGQEMPAG